MLKCSFSGHISLPVMSRLELTLAFGTKGEDGSVLNKDSTDNSRLS